MENQKTTTTPEKVTLKPSSETTPSQSAFEVKKGDDSVMKSFGEPKSGPSTIKVLGVLLLMAAFGVGTGYGLASYTAQTGKSVVPSALNPNAPQKGQTFGVKDTSAYKDSTEGLLKKGGIEGEGQYHLERPGGDSQNVYMTSSTVDLSKFVGKKIKVWGATQTAQKAGWLMDVGKVEVL